MAQKSPYTTLGLYTSTKLAGEALVESYAHSYGLKCTVLRPQIIYGPSRGNEGSTAGLSIALKEARAGRTYTIPFSGTYAFTFSSEYFSKIGRQSSSVHPGYTVDS